MPSVIACRGQQHCGRWTTVAIVQSKHFDKRTVFSTGCFLLIPNWRLIQKAARRSKGMFPYNGFLYRYTSSIVAEDGHTSAYLKMNLHNVERMCRFQISSRSEQILLSRYISTKQYEQIQSNSRHENLVTFKSFLMPPSVAHEYTEWLETVCGKLKWRA